MTRGQKLFAWSVVRQQWFQVLNALGSPMFMPATAAEIGKFDVAITMPTAIVSRPTATPPRKPRTV